MQDLYVVTKFYYFMSCFVSNYEKQFVVKKTAGAILINS